jgi:hypothetical protein
LRNINPSAQVGCCSLAEKNIVIIEGLEPSHFPDGGDSVSPIVNEIIRQGKHCLRWGRLAQSSHRLFAASNMFRDTADRAILWQVTVHLDSRPPVPGSQMVEENACILAAIALVVTARGSPVNVTL